MSPPWRQGSGAPGPAGARGADQNGGRVVPALSNPTARPGAVCAEPRWTAPADPLALQPWGSLLCGDLSLSASLLPRGLGWPRSDGGIPGLVPGRAPQPVPRPDAAHTVPASLRTLSGVLTSVLFCFLHVQFCKANSRYCISQLICLQRNLTVSLSATISIYGFVITTRQRLLSAPNSASHFKSFASGAAPGPHPAAWPETAGTLPDALTSCSRGQALWAQPLLLSLLVSVLLPVCPCAVTLVS